MRRAKNLPEFSSRASSSDARDAFANSKKLRSFAQSLRSFARFHPRGEFFFRAASAG